MPRQRITAVAVDDCPVCAEVDALHRYGFAGADILRALGRNAEAVGRHVKTHAPHLLPVIVDEVRAATSTRKARP